MGPGDGIQIQRLMDLPTTLETADQHQQQHSGGSSQSSLGSQQQQPVQRVKSMFQQSTGKLPTATATGARLAGAGSHPAAPPQRSISHNEVRERTLDAHSTRKKNVLESRETNNTE